MTVLILILIFDYKSSASTSCKIQDSGHMLTLQNNSPLEENLVDVGEPPVTSGEPPCVSTLGKSSVRSWLTDTDRPSALWSLTANLRILRIEWNKFKSDSSMNKKLYTLPVNSVDTAQHKGLAQEGVSTLLTGSVRLTHTVCVQSHRESTPGCYIQTTRCVFCFNLPLPAWILQGIEHPVRTNQIPRQIPEQSFYTKPFPGIVMGGILPFGCIFIQLFFILNSIWWAKRLKRLILKNCPHFWTETLLWFYNGFMDLL